MLKHFFSSSQTIYLIVIDSTKDLDEQSKELLHWFGVLDSEMNLDDVSICVVMTKADTFPQESRENHFGETKEALLDTLRKKNFFPDADGQLIEFIFTSCLDHPRFVQCACFLLSCLSLIDK